MGYWPGKRPALQTTRLFYLRAMGEREAGFSSWEAFLLVFSGFAGWEAEREAVFLLAVS